MNELHFDEIREQKSLFDVNTDMEVDVEIEEWRQPKSLFENESEIEEESVPWPAYVVVCEKSEDSEKVGFWRRQFQPNSTRTQRGFDWAFGVILPTVCFAADPIVFNDKGLLEAYRPFAYILAAISITSMVLWLPWARHYRIVNAAFSGLFAVGSLISLAVGIILFPFSLLGLVFLIGALGFTPLISSFIYLRNSYRAYWLAAGSAPTRLIRNIFLVSALWSLVFPYVMNVQAGTWKNPVTYIREIYYGTRF